MTRNPTLFHNPSQPSMALDGDGALPADMFKFVLRSNEANTAGLRLGQLAVHGIPPIATPTFVASTSRGAVPHIAQDVMSRLTKIPAVYLGLEDFIERTPQKAPVFKQPHSTHSRIRDFVSLPANTITILGPRRNPAVECPNQNTNSSIAMCTSVGFQSLQLDEYVQSANELGADITLSLADIVPAKPASQKRLEKSADRTHAWMRDTLSSRQEANDPHALFASVPPLEPNQQSFYLSDLVGEYCDELSGIGLSSVETAATLPEALSSLPRICLTNPESPHDLIRAIDLGNDLIAAPFVTDTSEKGIAMAFSFHSAPDLQHVPTGVDLWSTTHATDLSALVRDCQCYTCTRHHRAFVHHLLSAKEMLAWTLLQIHNFHIVDAFFEDIRQSITDGSFLDKAKNFSRTYEKEPLQTTGEGPRVRGYQIKSVGGGEPKKNRKAYGRLDEQAMKLDEAESGVATPEAGTAAEDLQKHGMGEAQI